MAMSAGMDQCAHALLWQFPLCRARRLSLTEPLPCDIFDWYMFWYVCVCVMHACLYIYVYACVCVPVWGLIRDRFLWRAIFFHTPLCLRGLLKNVTS